MMAMPGVEPGPPDANGPEKGLTTAEDGELSPMSEVICRLSRSPCVCRSRTLRRARGQAPDLLPCFGWLSMDFGLATVAIATVISAFMTRRPSIGRGGGDCARSGLQASAISPTGRIRKIRTTVHGAALRMLPGEPTGHADSCVRYPRYLGPRLRNSHECCHTVTKVTGNRAPLPHVQYGPLQVVLFGPRGFGSGAQAIVKTFEMLGRSGGCVAFVPSPRRAVFGLSGRPFALPSRQIRQSGLERAAWTCIYLVRARRDLGSSELSARPSDRVGSIPLYA